MAPGKAQDAGNGPNPAIGGLCSVGRTPGEGGSRFRNLMRPLGLCGLLGHQKMLWCGNDEYL